MISALATRRSSIFRALPISELKINRCFVQSMSTDQNASTIVRTIVNLAHSLGMQVVAEGVEDRATFTRLTVIGCDQVQGHLFGRPVAVDGLENLLRKSSRSFDLTEKDRRGTSLAAPLAERDRFPSTRIGCRIGRGIGEAGCRVRVSQWVTGRPCSVSKFSDPARPPLKGASRASPRRTSRTSRCSSTSLP